jgi:hypothetical protein
MFAMSSCAEVVGGSVDSSSSTSMESMLSNSSISSSSSSFCLFDFLVPWRVAFAKFEWLDALVVRGGAIAVV